MKTSIGHEFPRTAAGYADACAWRDAAVADGWAKEIYFASEPVDQSCQLRRDGFLCSILTRTDPFGMIGKYWLSISIWGPDDLAIETPAVYSWPTILAGTMACLYCKATGVATERVGFASRCCESCLPSVKAEVEAPGWCD